MFINEMEMQKLANNAKVYAEIIESESEKNHI